jgi:alpha 1,3-glucosidase
MLRNGKEEVVINGDGLFHMEHSRVKPEPPPAEETPASDEGSDENPVQTIIESSARPQAWFEGEEDDWWEEQFSTWKDSKPKGLHFLLS